MKRFYFLTLIILSVLTSYAKERSLSEKMQAAQMALLNHGTYAKAQVKAAPFALKLIKQTPQLSIIGNGNQGYAVIANDDQYDAVLGYSKTAYSDVMPDGLLWWLTEMDKALAAAKAESHNYLQDGDYKAAVEPLIGTTWGQGSPYNNLCPNRYPSGCVATAMSQIMWYHKYPEHGVGSIMDFGKVIFVDFSSTTYDYANMLTAYTDNQYTTKQGDAVATLMYHCGIASNMKYASSGSGTTTIDAVQALKKYFSYNKNVCVKFRDYNSTADWMQMVYTELSNGRPILYGANDKVSGGHAFVFEGYDADGKVYVNWGWDGTANGYYNIDLLAPIGTDYSFTESQDMILGIAKPEVDIAHSPNIVANDDLDISVSAGKLVFNWYKNFAAYNLYDYTFQGAIYLVAQDGNGNYTELWGGDFSDVKSLNGGTFNKKFTIDDELNTLADGKYTLKLMFAEDGYDGVFPVTYPEGKIKAYTLTKAGSNLSLSEGSTTGISQVSTSASQSSPYTYIYNMQGQEIYKAPTASFRLSDVPANGILIVKQGNTVKKIVK